MGTRKSDELGSVSMTVSVCARCDSSLRQGLTFTFKTSQGEASKCLYCALLHWPMLKRSLVTALAVGTVLALLNQGNIVLTGSWDSQLYWKIPLTYCVPFLVVSWGALANGRR